MRNIKKLSRNCVITGAGSGIGRALARILFQDEDCDLILIDKSEEALKTLQAELRPSDGFSPPLGRGSVSGFVCDISISAGVRELKDKMADSRVDVLVNCAGITYVGDFAAMELNDFESIVQTNLLGTVRVTHSILPLLLKSERPSIVNVSSLAGLVGAPGMSAYSASKFGVVGFSRALALELKGRVSICTVCPSYVGTPIAKNRIRSKGKDDLENEKQTDRLEKIIQKFGASPNRVARLIIQAIKRKKKWLLVNPDSVALHYMNRFLPDVTDELVLRAFQFLERRGTI